MNPSYSIIRSLCVFLIEWFYHRKNSVYRHVLSDKRLCDVFFVIRQKAMQWDFVIRQKAIQCCCLGWQTKGYEMCFFFTSE